MKINVYTELVGMVIGINICTLSFKYPPIIVIRPKTKYFFYGSRLQNHFIGIFERVLSYNWGT
jgi:hypothetical protein